MDFSLCLSLDAMIAKGQRFSSWKMIILLKGFFCAV